MEEIMQENALVKEMLKSHKTMIKIKDNEIERLKQKTTTPDAKWQSKWMMVNVGWLKKDDKWEMIKH